MAPRGNHGAPDRAFSVWWRRRPTGSSDGPFSGGARSKRFPRQYTNICVCCSVARTITEAHCYDAFAKRPVEFTPRSSQGARVLSDVRARGSCHARRTLGRSGGGGGCFLPRVLLRYLSAAAGRAAERVSRAHQAQCQIKELTQLWQVGVRKRKEAHSSGIYRWDDPQVTPAAVGVNGQKTGPTLAQLLTVNTDGGPSLLPLRIEKTRGEWHPTPGVEFYVDFEFCSDLNDDFPKLPEKGGQPLIFMIGCGHVENGEWQFKSLVAEHLSAGEEIRIINEWVDHMGSVRDRLDPQNGIPRVFHWSAAEPTVLDKAYNSAKARHPEHADWPELGWYDFMTKVMKDEPVAVRGALGFGLKAVANAFHSLGLIKTDWADSPIDGLGAMVGAWRCDEEAKEQAVPMGQLPLINEIAHYNEVDCKVMMEIVCYLRASH